VTELETPGTGAETTRARAGNRRNRRNRRWPALIGGLVLAAVKSEGLARLVVHRGGLIAACSVWLAVAVLKVKPIAIAVTAALLGAVVLGAHSFGLGLELGFGGFALLMALFFAISTVLHLRQRR
jgi:hypothetical protein